jgi:hypothetical protein
MIGSMRPFLLGVLATLTALTLTVVALVLSLPVDPGPPEPSPPPSGAGAGAPTRVPRGQTLLRDVTLSSSSVLTGDGPLEQVRASGNDVLLTPGGLVAGRLAIEAVLPFESAARQVGPDVTLSAAPGGLVGIRRTVSLLGRPVQVRATGSVRAENGQLVIEAQSVDLDGPDWLDAGLSAAARQLVTIRHTVQGLPAGMRLTRVSVAPDGFQAYLEGSRVRLSTATR